ncbi:putative ABC transport system ATP-binding protein [Metabacillus crassostreae]|nr:putative ABC transport system ATP-binding protein [Metabacillus crassostreae]
MFTIKNLQFKDILDIETMDIPENRITCIVGESGAGKSTLLKMLNIMLSPDQGEIYYKGKNLLKEDPIKHRRLVVMLPQQPTIFDGTIRENINIGLKFAGNDVQDDSKLLNALKLVHLAKSLDEDAETLSGGEKQRLALARAYIMNPEVFLLDEPTAALDDDTEDKVMESFINKIKENNQTAVLITHSQKLAAKYGENKITLYKKGGGSK